jgi:hypothetical protein
VPVSALQVTLEPKELAVVANAVPPQEWQGDLLILGVFEECFDTVGTEFPVFSFCVVVTNRE